MKWLAGIGRGSSASDGRRGGGGFLGEPMMYFSGVVRGRAGVGSILCL